MNTTEFEAAVSLAEAIRAKQLELRGQVDDLAFPLSMASIALLGLVLCAAACPLALVSGLLVGCALLLLVYLCQQQGRLRYLKRQLLVEARCFEGVSGLIAELPYGTDQPIKQVIAELRLTRLGLWRGQQGATH